MNCEVYGAVLLGAAGCPALTGLNTFILGAVCIVAGASVVVVKVKSQEVGVVAEVEWDFVVWVVQQAKVK